MRPPHEPVPLRSLGHTPDGRDRSATGRELDTGDRVRAAGLRATRPRLLVLELLEHLGGHRSADEVVAALADEGYALPRATVYNVLRDLTAVGLVTLADAGPGPALYEAGASWHHHFVCRVCEEVTDVECVPATKPCMTPDLPGAEVDEAQVIFRGTRASCGTAVRVATHTPPR